MARPPGTASRLLRVLTATLMARGVFFMGITSDDPTLMSAGITGSAGCGEAGACKQFDHYSPDGVADFSATDSRDSDGDRAAADLDTVQVRTPHGDLVSATVSGSIEVRQNGGGRTSAGATFDLTLYEYVGPVHVTATATMNARGSEFIVSYASLDLDLECGGREVEHELDVDAGGGTPDGARNESYSEAFQADGDHDCSFSVGASVGSATNRPAPGESGMAKLTFEVRINAAAAAPEGCQGVHGVVRDGAADDGHENPMRGIRVELRNDSSPVADPVVTDEAGGYCVGEDVDPGTYRVRATLVDAANDPPLFETKHEPGTTENWIEVPVTADEFDPERAVDVAFTSPDSNTIADMANIHWQSERFVRWLTTSGRIPPATLRPFTILTFSTRTAYRPSTREVRISATATATDPADSRFDDRDEPHDEGPENLEWHEIAHHLGFSIGIGTAPNAACPSETPHGGWSNGTSCDSLQEGFPSFVATLASLEIDAGLGAGYADPVYSRFWSLETNQNRPWSFGQGAGGTVRYFEDFAASELLWDLADDTPTEQDGLEVRGIDGVDYPVHARDQVALGGTNLLGILADIRPSSVDDLYRGLVDSPLVPQDLKTRVLDIESDLVSDLSALDEVFLLHGFHETRSLDVPAYNNGDAFGRTDHPVSEGAGAANVPRPHTPALEGANLRLRNPSANDVTVTVAVTGLDVAMERSYAVPAGSERIVHLEVPQPWPGAAAAGAAAARTCDQAGLRLATITISAPGVAPRSLDSCAYLQAVAAATDGTALTFDAAAGDSAPVADPGADGTPPALWMVVGAAVVIALAFLVFLAIRRRSPSAAS